MVIRENISNLKECVFGFGKKLLQRSNFPNFLKIIFFLQIRLFSHLF